MGIFDFLRTKRTQHELTQEERNAGGETKSIKSQLAQARAELEIARLRLEAERDRIRLQAEIEEARQDLEDLTSGGEEEGGSGGSPEDVILTTFLSTLMAKQQGTAPQITAPVIPPAPQKIDLEDQQISEVWKSLSKDHQKIARKMPDSQLKAIINANIPGISDESLGRAVAFIRRS